MTTMTYAVHSHYMRDEVMKGKRRVQVVLFVCPKWPIPRIFAPSSLTQFSDDLELDVWLGKLSPTLPWSQLQSLDFGKIMF